MIDKLKEWGAGFIKGRLKNVRFCSRPRKAKILTTGIHAVFRGLKFEPDTGIGQKGTFFKGLIKCCLIIIGYCIPKRGDLWVFGCRLGKYYNDNSRFLFEYVVENEPAIHAVWITKDRDIFNYLSAKKRNVYFADSLKGFYYCARAKAAVICVDHGDVNKFALAGTQVVHLWHGVKFKVEYDSYRYNQIKGDQNGVVGQLIALIRKIHLVIATAPNQVEPMSHLLGVKKEIIKITGYPKMDYLFSPPDPHKTINSYIDIRLPEDKKIVLYLPTWRPPLGMEYDLFEQFGFDFEKIETVLHKNNAVLVYIPHYVTKISDKAFIARWRRSKHLVLYNNRTPFFDPNLLYPWVSAIITDYSSVFLNFLTRNRPVIFAPFDMDYFTQHVGLPFDYETFTPGPKAENWDELCRHLDLCLSGADTYHSQRKKILDLFHYYQDAHSSKRVVAEIRKLVS